MQGVSSDLPDAALVPVIGALYDAPFAADGWQRALDTLGALIPSVGLSLYAYDADAPWAGGGLHSGFDPAAMAEFDRAYAGLSAWAPALLAAPVGTLLCTDAMLPREDLFKTVHYNEWLRRQDNLVMAWGSILLRDDSRYVIFSAALRARDESSLSSPVRAAVERLMPHVRRAFGLSRHVAHAVPEASTDALLDSIGEPAFVLDRDARVLGMNGLAAQLADIGPGQDGALRLHDARATVLIAAGLDRLADDAVASTVPAFSTVQDDGRRYTAILTPIARPPDGSGPLAWFWRGMPAAILVLRRDGYDLGLRLRAGFALSPAETEVALALGAGRSPRDVALARGTSLATVRNQIRQVFEKLGVRRNAELVTMLAHFSDGQA